MLQEMQNVGEQNNLQTTVFAYGVSCTASDSCDQCMGSVSLKQNILKIEHASCNNTTELAK